MDEFEDKVSLLTEVYQNTAGRSDSKTVPVRRVKSLAFFSRLPYSSSRVGIRETRKS